jgi:spermidine synthase
MADKRWIAETLFDELGFRISYRVDKVHYEARTADQHLLLFEHAFFGKTLMLDGAVQITKRDEFIYQEMMAHVPLFAHGNARDMLIIAGGDCGIADEALKHKTLQRVVQVEIDASVIEFAKQHFPEFTRPAFADARFNSVVDDGMRYVAATERRFDVIIVDSTDPQGPGKVLFSRRFYAACRRRLNTLGVLVTQNFNRVNCAPASVRCGGCSRTPPATSRQYRPMSAAIWPCAGPAMTKICGKHPRGPSLRVIDEPAASPRNTGRPRFRSPRSRCHASSPTRLPKSCDATLCPSAFD